MIACTPSLNFAREWQPTPVLLPGKSHGQRSQVGYSPWRHKESDTVGQLTHTVRKNLHLGVCEIVHQILECLPTQNLCLSSLETVLKHTKETLITFEEFKECSGTSTGSGGATIIHNEGS